MEEIKMDKTKEREYEVMTSFWTCLKFCGDKHCWCKSNLAGNVQGNRCRKRWDCLPEGPHSLSQMPQWGAFGQ